MFLFRSRMDLAKDFTDELAAFLAATGIKPSGFGRRALGDPNFVAELKHGRSPNLRTIARARAFMVRETARLAMIAARRSSLGAQRPKGGDAVADRGREAATPSARQAAKAEGDHLKSKAAKR
jgi:hypothetical protein